MNSTADIRIRLDAILYYCGAFLAVFILSILLARSWFLAAVLGGALVWALVLPFHSRLALLISMAAFNSAFIVPFSPGPLTVTDAATLLAWSGVPLAIMLRRYPSDTGRLFHDNRALFLGIGIYFLALGIIMYARGVGFGFLGATAGGGKVYFRQVLTAIVPLLFLVTPITEKTFVRMVTLHFVLSITFLMSDAVLALMPGAANVILRFLQLPTDAVFFELTTRHFGFRRLQSLYYVCPKLVFALLLHYSLKDVLGRKAWWLIPAIVGLLAAGLGSGHRANLIHTGFVLIALSLIQRSFNIRNLLLLGFTVVVGLTVLYTTVDIMPAAVQRSISFLPGIDIDSHVAADAAATWHSRLEATRRGLAMIPEYWTLGRGFTRYADLIPNSREVLDSVAYAVLQGHFLNGFVGLMVNTGLLGTIGMCLFLLAGARLALRVVRQARRIGFDTTIARTGAVLTSLYFVDVFFFFMIEGNVDWAIPRFGMYAGMLFPCHRMMQNMVPPEDEAEPVAADELSDAR